MDKEEKIEPYYQSKAKYIVDAMFDKGYFTSELTRSDMQKTEDLIALMISLEVKSAVRASEMLRKIREKKSTELQ